MNNNIPPESFERTESRKRFIINFLFFGLLFAISVLLVRFALVPLLPFVIALLVSLILRPVVRFCAEKCHINRRVAATVLVVLFYATIGVLVILLVIALAHYVIDRATLLPAFYNEKVLPALNNIFEQIQDIINRIDPEGAISLEGVFDKVLDGLYDFAIDISKTAAKELGSLAVSVPSILLNVIITVISTVFLLMDFDIIRRFLHDQLPEKVSHLLHNAGAHLGHVIRKYIVSYALIMIITFLEIWIGLLIIGVKNAAAIAALVAVFDILPIVGSGLILVPWAVISFVLGNIGHGIGIILLWAILTVIRQIIEPKIVGSSVGMHPFLTLFAMLAGNFIYGGIGILLLPISIALCQSLNKAGVINIYKATDEDPEPPSKLNIFADRVFSAIAAFFRKLFKNKNSKKKVNKKKGSDTNSDS